MTRIGFLSSCLLLAGLIGSGAPRVSASAPTAAVCAAESTGLDVSLATTSGSSYLGVAWGQTFMAMDTLIESVTVWRIPQEAASDSSDMKFWLTQVDTTTGDPKGPLIQEGPKLSLVTNDTIRPTKIQYVFSPAINLPRRGQYCFWIQACDGYFDLLIDPHNDYSGGHLWQSDRSNFSGCMLAGANPFAADLAFQVVFCGAALTPTFRETWGQLKVRYR